MPAGPVMIKILVLGTLLMGSLVLLANFLPGARPGNPRRRRTGPTAGVTAFIRHANAGAGPAAPRPTGKVRKTAEQWRAELTEEQYRVTRCSATERPFTGRYWNHREQGTYQCVGCGQDLFASGAKYDAGTGWPSYTRPANDEAVDEIKDISYGMVRTEVVCSRCEAHLGHVFADGPPPTGRRYCINSAALAFAGRRGTGQIDPPQRAAGE